VSVHGSRCTLEWPDGRTASALGHVSAEPVVVGDRVQVAGDADDWRITSIDPRSSLLYRSDGMRSKTLAANVSRLAVVFASEPRFSVDFLWRALLAAGTCGIGAIAILNKIDLPDQAAERALAQMRGLGARCLRICARREPDQAAVQLREELRGQATLMVGPSGVGKSTIVNLLLGERARTRSLSAGNRTGRHTTSASRWYRLEPDGGALVDTPGFGEFGLNHLSPAQLQALMPDLAPLVRECRFTDCLHLEEPDCAVRSAVTAGRLDAERYAFFRRLCTPAGQ